MVIGFRNEAFVPEMQDDEPATIKGDGIMNAKALYIVIPCFNEQAVLPLTSDTLKAKLDKLKADGAVSPDSRVLFVNNHSTDDTFSIIESISKQYPDCFTGISLSRNCGQQIALVAGLETAAQYADVMITMDADLQDDPEAIDEMLKKNADGAEIVYGVRSSRQSDSFFKRITAKLFYRLSDRLEMGLISDHGDFRLMNKRAVLALSKYSESESFLRGIVPRLGFQSDTVYYKRQERLAGESSYSTKQLMDFAVSGITATSTKPLRFAFWLGFVDIILSLAVLIAGLVITEKMTDLHLAALVLWLAGTNKLFIGILGEYIAKAYRQTKLHPAYFIERNLSED